MLIRHHEAGIAEIRGNRANNWSSKLRRAKLDISLRSKVIRFQTGIMTEDRNQAARRWVL